MATLIDTPRVSVVISTFNGASFIREALESVLGQTLLPKEIIVVDDCSTDGTADLVESIMPHISLPFRLIRLQKNSGGPAHPVNVGIAAATAEVIAVLDQDDVFFPEKLDEQLTIYSSAPHLSFSFGFCSLDDSPPKINQAHSLVQELICHSKDYGKYREIPGSVAFELFMRHGNYLIGYPAFIFPRKQWERKGGLDETFKIASDYELLCWLSLQGNVGFIPKPCYRRRTHCSNASRNWLDTYIDVRRVRAHYITCVPALLQKDELAEKLRDDLLGLSYWLRESGDYENGLKYLVLSVRLWGFRRDVIWLTVKFLIRRLMGRWSCYSNGGATRSWKKNVGDAGRE